jgi:hypothetical protein
MCIWYCYSLFAPNPFANLILISSYHSQTLNILHVGRVYYVSLHAVLPRFLVSRHEQWFIFTFSMFTSNQTSLPAPNTWYVCLPFHSVACVLRLIMFVYGYGQCKFCGSNDRSMPRTVPVNQHHLECRVQKLFLFLHERAQQDYVNCASYIAGEVGCLR